MLVVSWYIIVNNIPSNYHLWLVSYILYVLERSITISHSCNVLEVSDVHLGKQQLIKLWGTQWQKQQH